MIVTLNPGQKLWNDIFNGVGDYSSGYTFVINLDGKITQLWANVNDTALTRVSVWDVLTQVELAHVIVTGNPADWVSGDLAVPLDVTAGTTYHVTAYTQNYRKTSVVTPKTADRINVIHGVYGYGGGFPTIWDFSFFFGADITYVQKNDTGVFVYGVASASDAHSNIYRAELACDGSIFNDSRWSTSLAGVPCWWKYDLGVGVAKIVNRLRLLATGDYGSESTGQFTFSGSNDDITYDLLCSATRPDIPAWSEHRFLSSIAYRYYRLDVLSTYDPRGYAGANEIEAYGPRESGPLPLHFRS